MFDQEFIQDEFEDYDPFELDSSQEVEEPVEDEDIEDETKEPREDKIFNNRYNTGDGLDDEDYYFTKNISVSSDYSDQYLKDLYDYENELNLKVVLDFIFQKIQEDEELGKIFKHSIDNINSKKLKISKAQINFIFNRLHECISSCNDGILFYSPIYILEVISSVSSIEYRKIFDQLDTENQEILLLELNEKYLFLDGKINKKRIH